MQSTGRPPEEVWRLFAGFTAYSEPFRSSPDGARQGEGLSLR